MQINNRIQELIKKLKKGITLGTKFYTWVFGIQAEIYMYLINFSN
jgi:hypothetical protein